MHTLHGPYEAAIDRWLGELPERLEAGWLDESLAGRFESKRFRRSS